MLAALYAHAHAMLRPKRCAWLGFLVAQELEAVPPGQHCKHGLRLHVSKVIAEADAWPGPEGEIGVAAARGFSLHQESIRIETFGIVPRSRRVVQCPRRNHHVCPRAERIPTNRDGLVGVPRKHVDGWREAQRFLEGAEAQTKTGKIGGGRCIPDPIGFLLRRGARSTRSSDEDAKFGSGPEWPSREAGWHASCVCVCMMHPSADLSMPGRLTVRQSPAPSSERGSLDAPIGFGCG